jgi:VWFA-related protein
MSCSCAIRQIDTRARSVRGQRAAAVVNVHHRWCRQTTISCGELSMRLISARLPILLLSACGLLAQTAPPPLVLLRPIVSDTRGQPLNDLTAADFKITDQDKAQTIYFFRRPAPPNPPMGPREYSNRPNGVPPHATAILFDLMSDSEANWVDTWRLLTKSVPQVEPGGLLYFYLLDPNGELVPVHGFGSEAGGNTNWQQTFKGDLDKAMDAANRVTRAGIDREDRAKKTYVGVETLARQLASLPGRKDIVWITSRMPVITNSLRCKGDWVDCGLYVAHSAVTLEGAGVAVNPASFSGVVDPYASYDLEQMALLTGGRTFFGPPLQEVLRQLAGNSNGVYEIAYAPDAQNWDNKFHRVHVTCERKGVKLQVKERYYALPDSRSAKERQQEALQSAYNRPSDTSDIGLRVKVSPAANGVHLEIRIDAPDILLRERDGRFLGAMTILLSDRGAAEQAENRGLQFRPIGEPVASTATLDLTKDEYDQLMRNGIIPISQDQAIAPAAERMRVIVFDQNTDRSGSVTFSVH